jgi:hypothetical protein
MILRILIASFIIAVSAKTSFASSIASRCLASVDRGRVVFTEVWQAMDHDLGKTSQIKLDGIEVWEATLHEGTSYGL